MVLFLGGAKEADQYLLHILATSINYFGKELCRICPRDQVGDAASSVTINQKTHNRESMASKQKSAKV
jgi:hypothetical protein